MPKYTWFSTLKKIKKIIANLYNIYVRQSWTQINNNIIEQIIPRFKPKPVKSGVRGALINLSEGGSLNDIPALAVPNPHDS